MQSRCKLKRFVALLLTVLMVLACMPMTVMAEEPTVPDDGVSVEVIADESGNEPIEAFDKFVEQWKSLGGDTITEEVNERFGK